MNIYILNTLEVGIDIAKILIKSVNIKGMIGLSDRTPGDKISGYSYLKPFCDANNLDFVPVDTYFLTDPADKERLLALDIDILIVSGWQRLIPDWLIDHCQISAIGSHGSSEGITRGRGRSPQNWALILGKTVFYISIFAIDSGIDSGHIIDTKKYTLSEFDDIKSSYYKVCCLTAQMIGENIRNNTLSSQHLSQQSEEPRYLPQRLPKDGEIDWARTSREIYNFIRALTRPYPGAFSNLNNQKLTIWRARPFDIQDYSPSNLPGQVSKVFDNSDMLIKTGDSFLLVEDYNLEPSTDNPSSLGGEVLSSCDFHAQMRKIVRRHYKKYPDLILSEDFLALQ